MGEEPDRARKVMDWKLKSPAIKPDRHKSLNEDELRQTVVHNVLPGLESLNLNSMSSMLGRPRFRRASQLDSVAEALRPHPIARRQSSQSTITDDEDLRYLLNLEYYIQKIYFC